MESLSPKSKKKSSRNKAFSPKRQLGSLNEIQTDSETEEDEEDDENNFFDDGNDGLVIFFLFGLVVGGACT